MRASSATPIQMGLTLIELMVALVISLILAAGAMRVFIGSVEISRFQRGQGGVQEVGRFVLAELSEEIRGTGYRGCARSAVIPTRFQDLLADGQDNATVNEFFQGSTVNGYTQDVDGNWVGAGSGLPSELKSASPAPDGASDVLIVRTTAAQTVVSIQNANNTTLTVSNAEPIAQDDIVVATDCRAAFLGQVTATDASADEVTFGGGQNNGDITADFDQGSVYAVNRVAYYQANPSDARPALYRLRLPTGVGSASGTWPSPQRVAPGVSRLAFRYGEDTSGDGTPDTYSGAGVVGNWGDVTTVRAGVITVSRQQNLTDDAGTQFTWPPGTNNTIQFNDQRLRQRLTTTIMLRNRLL